MNRNYSPDIKIFLDINGQIIRLADLLHNSATLYNKATVAPGTMADLVISIDGNEKKEQVCLHLGIAEDADTIEFQYFHVDSTVHAAWSKLNQTL